MVMNDNQSQSQQQNLQPRGKAQLRLLLELLPGRLAAIPNGVAAAKQGPESWSPKQELGHLIDSAANNHQRIVRAQLADNLALPDYDGDRWVEVHSYQKRDWTELIALWRAGNSQLLRAAESAPDSSWNHRLTIGGSEPVTLRLVLDDYIDHMANHLRHIGVQVDDLLASALQDGIVVYPEKRAQTEYPINELMRKRWSPRAFAEGRTVPRETLLTLLDAARWGAFLLQRSAEIFPGIRWFRRRSS